jgi:uncharacterized membrane protein
MRETRCEAERIQQMRLPTVPTISILFGLLVMSSAARGSMPSEYKCNGNEPFWGLAINNENAGWATPGEPEGRTLEGTFRHLDYAGIFSWRGEFEEGDLVAFVRYQPCSDTMVDREYPYSIQVSLPDGTVLLGCCDTISEPRTEGRSESDPGARTEVEAVEVDEILSDLPVAILDEKPPGDWSRHLLALLPGIESCLAETPGVSPRVIKAWTTSNEQIEVRTWGAETAAWECVATRQGSVVRPLTALKGETVGLHDGWSPIFTLRGQSPPSGECYQHERVVDARGALIGWLSYDTC